MVWFLTKWKFECGSFKCLPMSFTGNRWSTKTICLMLIYVQCNLLWYYIVVNQLSDGHMSIDTCPLNKSIVLITHLRNLSVCSRRLLCKTWFSSNKSAKFYFKLSIYPSQNQCVNYPSSVKLAHWAKQNGHYCVNAYVT